MNTFSFTAAGDMLVQRRLPGDYEGFNELSEFIKRGTARYFNLETTLNHGEGWGNQYGGGSWLKADPVILEDVRQYGFNMLSFANNHSLDFSHWGLLETIKKGMHPVVNVALCTVFGAILVKQPLLGLGGIIYESMGSFLALVGFIIMLGSGLGVVLRKTGVAATVVNFLMKKIGVKTQKRAILATMVCSIVLVTFLGTLAGANAVIAPIVIPLVAAVSITPSTLAVIFQGAGQTGLFLSPFSPPMVTLMGITGLSYPKLLVCAGLPIAVVMWIGTFLVALKVQKQTEGKEFFDNLWHMGKGRCLLCNTCHDHSRPRHRSRGPDESW